jgi:hypothetical protein
MRSKRIGKRYQKIALLIVRQMAEINGFCSRYACLPKISPYRERFAGKQPWLTAKVVASKCYPGSLETEEGNEMTSARKANLMRAIIFKFEEGYQPCPTPASSWPRSGG